MKPTLIICTFVLAALLPTAARQEGGASCVNSIEINGQQITGYVELRAEEGKFFNVYKNGQTTVIQEEVLVKTGK